jgi:outer membrane protein assembly factor BamB
MPWIRSLIILLVFALGASAADWPQWLGINRDASTTESVKPWKGDLKVVWKKPVGEGHSSPVVANGKVYLHTKATKSEEEVMQAWDAKTGAMLWETDYKRDPYIGLFGNGPRATPLVADGKIYAFGISGILTCFDAD